MIEEAWFAQAGASALKALQDGSGVNKADEIFQALWCGALCIVSASADVPTRTT
ncbi:MAG: hypothetical protein WDM92_07290 [Caulobacteraceae bacterium]